jgi:hypothetical protein
MSTFQFVPATEKQKEVMNYFRNKYENLANELKERVNASRGLSLAITKLEESSFWLNKSITEND